MQQGTFPFPEFVIFIMLGDISPPPTPVLHRVHHLVSAPPRCPPPGLVPLSPTGCVHHACPAVALLPLKLSDSVATHLWGPHFQQGQDRRAQAETRPVVQYLQGEEPLRAAGA